MLLDKIPTPRTFNAFETNKQANAVRLFLLSEIISVLYQFITGLFFCFLFVKFIYSEKATKFCKIFALLLSYVVPVKIKVTISQNFVAFSEYMNFSKPRDNNQVEQG